MPCLLCSFSPARKLPGAAQQLVQQLVQGATRHRGGALQVQM